mmetsp:Transcript_35093/g.79096  ORF Transcript_35093/g.79096 Transcript_35093/m.79096 type:complete len:212 (+) Transcript_35093:478-1113(+)
MPVGLLVGRFVTTGPDSTVGDDVESVGNVGNGVIGCSVVGVPTSPVGVGNGVNELAVGEAVGEAVSGSERPVGLKDGKIVSLSSIVGVGVTGSKVGFVVGMGVSKPGVGLGVCSFAGQNSATWFSMLSKTGKPIKSPSSIVVASCAQLLVYRQTNLPLTSSFWSLSPIMKRTAVSGTRPGWSSIGTPGSSCDVTDDIENVEPSIHELTLHA